MLNNLILYTAKGVSGKVVKVNSFAEIVKETTDELEIPVDWDVISKLSIVIELFKLSEKTIFIVLESITEDLITLKFAITWYLQ